MSTFRIEKTKDYAIMSNHHLRDMQLSLKAKGLLSLMLSLPENWDYTLKGLSHICQDGLSSVRSGILELEQQCYLTRQRIRIANGQLGDTEYTIHEQPQKAVDNSVENSSPTYEKPTSEKPVYENPILDNPMYENSTQLNTNILNTKESNTDLLNINQSINYDESSDIDTMDAIDIYSEMIKRNIAYDYLCEEYRHNRDEIEEIFELILEIVCSKKKTIRIGGEDKPVELVKKRMMKLDQSHVEYVIDSLRKNTTEVRNIRSYLLTALFNAPATIGNYYKARVNHDMYGNK